MKVETEKEEIFVEELEVMIVIILQKISFFTSRSITKAYIMILIYYRMLLFHTADPLPPFIKLRASDQELVVKMI